MGSALQANQDFSVLLTPRATNQYNGCHYGYVLLIIADHVVYNLLAPYNA